MGTPRGWRGLAVAPVWAAAMWITLVGLTPIGPAEATPRQDATPSTAPAIPGLVAVPDSVGLKPGKSATVRIVNVSAGSLTVSAVVDDTLSPQLAPIAGQILPRGEPRDFTLTAAATATATPLSGTVLFIGTPASGAPSSIAVAVTITPAAEPVSAAAQPDTVAMRTRSGTACDTVTLATGAGFAGAHGQLKGPHGQAPFALVAETVARKSSGSAEHLCRDRKNTAALLKTHPGGSDPRGRYLLLAGPLADSGTYSAPVVLDPADPKTTVAVSIERTYHWMTAVLWALLGSGLAVLLGVLATLWRQTKDTATADAAVKHAQADQDAFLELLRAHRHWLGSLYVPTRQNWTVVGDPPRPINDGLSADAVTKKRNALTTEIAAATNLLAAVAATGPPGHNTLVDTAIAAVEGPPDLDSDAGKGHVATVEQLAAPWFRVVATIDSIDPSQLSAEARGRLAEVRVKALALAGVDGKLDDPKAKAAVDGLEREVVTAAGASPRRTPPSHTLGVMNFGVDAVVGALSHAMAVTTSALHLSNSLRARVRRHAAISMGLFIVVETVAGLVALAVGVAAAVSDKYYGHATWGGPGDYLAMALWAVSASGGVQVAKLLVIGSPPITVKSD